MDGKNIVKKDAGSVEATRSIRKAVPLVDIYENDDEILLHAEMPGVRKDDIMVNIDNGRLTLSGTRLLGKQGAAEWEEFGDVEYQRAFSVPQTIDIEKVKAELKDGMLALHLPKSEAAKPRMVEITAG
ncbi:MAG: Hsp20/alpha crystallin family protein [Desulfocapsaceae bacterium]|nr:Hsp20/alpha crystallin family protein [Desulfocapsaceae bacterium]